ncbi:MAG TPA: (d)CMP kinase [Blastocatellia bacterium]|nr:(d)CMP kinase [Blastocatellia bacterium]
MKPIVIAIDGPSGVGKSTLGKRLAERLGYLYIDSGAVYRAIGSAALDHGVPLEDDSAVAKIARTSKVQLHGDPWHLSVLIHGGDVTERIRRPDASRAASIVATYPEVRREVVDKLRAMGQRSGVVMDGRDIGTKVFPDASVKLFLDADPRARVLRRWEEDRQRGREVPLEQIRTEIEERDRRDTERSATPLVKADAAILIDTSSLDIDEVISRALEIINQQR